MGLLQRILGKEKKVSAPAYRTFTDGAPNFSTWDGPIYEQEITRACIERFATACSKMKPEVEGESCPDVRKAVMSRPNPIMTWPTFLKRLAAVYDSDGTAFVVPVYGSDGWSKVGFFPVKCEFAEVVDVAGDPWVRFSFAAGEQTALPLNDVCILSKLQVQSDFFGEPNCLRRTMQLIDAQNQAQDAAIRNGAKIRFIGSVPGMVKPEQLEEKRRLFMEGNLSSSNVSGMMVYDQTFLDVKQVEPQSYTMDSAEMERITSNVCNYFGMSAPVLTTNFTEDQFGAWYESKVEPFGVQLGDQHVLLAGSAAPRKPPLILIKPTRIRLQRIQAKHGARHARPRGLLNQRGPRGPAAAAGRGRRRPRHTRRVRQRRRRVLDGGRFGGRAHEEERLRRERRGRP